MVIHRLLSLLWVLLVVPCDGNQPFDNQPCDEVSDESCSAQGKSMLQKAPPSINLISNDAWETSHALREVTEEDWQKVVNECCLASTDKFIHELLPQLGLQICDEGCHNGITPFWDCKHDLSLGSLQAQIMENAHSSCPCYGNIGECQPFPQQCLEQNTGEFNPYWHRRRACSKTPTEDAGPSVSKGPTTERTTITTTIQEVQCTPGFYHTSPTAACIECSGYTRRRRAEACTDCNAHHCHHGQKTACNDKLLYPVSNQDSCSPEVICNSGYYHKAALATCIECAGSARRRRAMSCTDCVAGRHNAPDQDDCDKELECHAGYFLAPSSFLQLEGNHKLSCAECEGSTRRRRANSCTACSGGTYTKADKDDCSDEIICESGFYHDSPEKDCVRCDGSARRRRSESCTDCDKGEHDVVDEDSCEAAITTSIPIVDEVPKTTTNGVERLVCLDGYYHPETSETCIECTGSTRRRRADSCTGCGKDEIHVVGEDDCKIDVSGASIESTTTTTTPPTTSTTSISTTPATTSTSTTITTIPTTKTTTTTMDCDYKYHVTPERSEKNPSSWVTANNCPDGMMLAMPQNEAEQACMEHELRISESHTLNEVTGVYDGNIMIGGTYDTEAEAWFWDNGFPIEWFNWKPGQSEFEPFKTQLYTQNTKPGSHREEEPGWINSITLSSSTHAVCQTIPSNMQRCTWKMYSGFTLEGQGGTEKVYNIVGSAKEACRGLGSVLCKGITCNANAKECTIRGSKKLVEAPGALTYLPSEACWDTFSCKTSFVWYTWEDNTNVCPSGQTNNFPWPDELTEENCESSAANSNPPRAFSTETEPDRPKGCYSDCAQRPMTSVEDDAGLNCAWTYNRHETGAAGENLWKICQENVLFNCPQ